MLPEQEHEASWILTENLRSWDAPKITTTKHRRDARFPIVTHAHVPGSQDLAPDLTSWTESRIVWP